MSLTSESIMHDFETMRAQFGGEEPYIREDQFQTIPIDAEGIPIAHYVLSEASEGGLWAARAVLSPVTLDRDGACVELQGFSVLGDVILAGHVSLPDDVHEHVFGFKREMLSGLEYWAGRFAED